MPEELIRETISITRTSASPEDKEISAAYNRLVRRAIKEAEVMLTFGSPETKLRIVLASMQAAGRLSALDTRSETEEQRYAFERLIDGMTDIPELTHVVTPKEIIDVAPKAVSRSAHDQDNEQRLPQVGS